MKNYITINMRFLLFFGLAMVLLSSCEREFSDDVEFATFPNDGDVFIDTFSSGLDYFPFVGDGADPEAFSVETEEVFQGVASMRFDVPAFGTGFVGAAFNTTAKRDLSGFDALTFYAKASQAADINEIGFGIDGTTNDRFKVTKQNLQVSTRWQKYIIPIPEASKLIGETGLLWIGEGAENETDESGFVLWLDEVKFEKLGTVAQPSPAIFSGENITEQSFIGSNLIVNGLTQTFNLESGINQTVLAAPSYFDFSSSNVDVALVNELGEISVVGEGTAMITAQLGGVAAEGSLEVTSSGSFQNATEPTRPAANVKSIFSDVYTDATEINFAPGFGGSTTQASLTSNNGDEILNYTNNNFTGIIFDTPVDGLNLNFLHVDVFVQESNAAIGIQIRDVGADQTVNTDESNGNPIGDDVDFRFTITGLTAGVWNSIDIPFGGAILNQKNNLGALILTDGPNFVLDNIYFYAE
ncbi:MAG: hypothetical protein Mars2KO_04150 [Maribacter sp.]